ncbi:LepB GTPase-activating domain-containing protein [Legionella micdadei]|uniref:LepB GTPase-activating domain-containing protein n=1 Tax=Legionella micdadei TaxID=451 RepID=UPI003A7F6CB2
MFEYEKQKLIKFKDKTAGKNRNPLDGFYETEGEPKKKYFIKKPADQRELFIEGLIGRLYKGLKDRNLIDERYHRSLICADFIQCEDGSYALIQPCEEFDELFKLIGTGYKDGSDRDPLYEMIYGPSLYPNLTKQKLYFGLSVVLMLAILVGNFSVHSGNIVVFKNSRQSEDAPEIKQFGGIDNGAANRDFARPENNEDILVPYEYKKGGLRNHAWFTKGYIANYRNIKGLLPHIASHARELSERIGGDFTEIITKVFKELPPDLLQNNQEVLAELAEYTAIPGFRTATFGPEGNCQSVIGKYAETLNLRLDKLGKLQEAPHLAKASVSVYESYIAPKTSSPSSSVIEGTQDEQADGEGEELPLETALRMEEPIAFPARLEAWLKHFADPRTPIDFSQIDYDLLIKDYNHYVAVLGRQGDLYNIWHHDFQSSSGNLLALSSKASFDSTVQTGYAYVPQYREGALLRHLYAFAAPGRHASERFSHYDKLDADYCREENEYCTTHKEAQPSAWLKVVTALQRAHGIMTLIKELQRTKGKEKEFAEYIPIWKEDLLSQLHEFKKASDIITDLFEKNTTLSTTVTASDEEKDTLNPRYNGLFFYPITYDELKEMSGAQLLTICLEELYSTQVEDIELSPLLTQIVSNDLFWNQAESAYSESTFRNRTDNPHEKMVLLTTWRSNLLEYRKIVLQFHQEDSLSKREELLSMAWDKLEALPLSLKAELRKDFEAASSILNQWKLSHDTYQEKEHTYLEASGQRKISAFKELDEAYRELPPSLKQPYQTAKEGYDKEILFLNSYEEFKKVQILEEKIAAFEPLKGLYLQLPPGIQRNYQPLLAQLQKEHELYQKVKNNQIVNPGYTVEKIERVFNLIRSNQELAERLMEGAISDSSLWHAIEATEKTVFTKEIAQDLLTIKQFHDHKTADNPHDQQFIEEINKFYDKALGIRLSQKTIKKQATEILKTAENEFTHRDKKIRFVADVIMLVSILFAGLGLFIMGGRYLAGKHPLFSCSATARQEELAEKWMSKTDQLTDETVEACLFTEPPAIPVN